MLCLTKRKPETTGFDATCEASCAVSGLSGFIPSRRTEISTAMKPCSILLYQRPKQPSSPPLRDPMNTPRSIYLMACLLSLTIACGQDDQSDQSVVLVDEVSGTGEGAQQAPICQQLRRQDPHHPAISIQRRIQVPKGPPRAWNRTM